MTSAMGGAGGAASSAGRIGTMSPTEPDCCGAGGVTPELDLSAAGLPAGGDVATISRASKTWRQSSFGHRMRTPRMSGGT